MNIPQTVFVTLLIICIFQVIEPVNLSAQNRASALTSDQLFAKAREMAFDSSDYPAARSYAYQALEKSPEYHEIRIFVARTFAWDGDYSSAREELIYVLERDPDNRQATLAMIDVDSWSGRYDKALEWAEKGLQYHPTDRDLLYQKASLLETSGETKQAVQTYNQLLDLHKGDSRARNALRALSLKEMKNMVTFTYRHDQFFEIFDPWDFFELQLNRSTGIGTVIGRVQYANRFSTGGIQFNVDAYPTITSGLYAYMNAGVSGSSIFPDYRFGFSLFKSLPAAFEVEGGLRYLNFTNSDVFIYTVSLSKYYGNYLFTGRTYLVPSSEGDSQSFSLLIRRYLSGAIKYVGIEGGYGTAAEEIRFSEDINRLDSWFVELEAQIPVGPRFYLGGNAGYDSEDFTNFKRERFSFSVYGSYRF